MVRMNGWRWGVVVSCMATAMFSSAQATFTSLVSFDGSHGKDPYGTLIQSPDGNFYGTTYAGGTGHNDGTVFKITASGKWASLHSFCTLANCADGIGPQGLVQATNGKLYGMTFLGGDGCGTVFEIAVTGALTTLHSFEGTDGCEPQATLIQAADGNFYGMTWGGGANGNGTVFKMMRGAY
jgi:uncharacterized repeat protein (TIGR03803 family)